MEISDAVIKGIPIQTKTEEIENDLTEMKGIFEGQDISGLDCDFRRHRRIKVDNIEDYLKNLDFKLEFDGDEEIHDSPKQGFFKKNYKMKLSGDEEIAENEWRLQEKVVSQSGQKQAQFSTVSTKSNFKKPEDSGMQLLLAPFKSGDFDMISFIISHKSRLQGAAIKDGQQIVINNKRCAAKIFTTKQKITMVAEEKREFSVINEYHPPHSNFLLPNRQLFLVDSLDHFDFSSKFELFLGGTTDTFIVSNEIEIQNLTTRDIDSLHCILVENSELIVLEFGLDSELSGQRDLIAIHICYQPASHPSKISSTLLSRIESITRQEGYCSMPKFLGKLFNINIPVTNFSSTMLNSKDVECRSSLSNDFEEMAKDRSGKQNNRKQSNSTGRKGSSVDQYENDFTENVSLYFQGITRERSSNCDGSFSM